MSDSWICFIEMTVSIIFTIFDYTWQWQHIGIKDIEQGGPKAANVEEKKNANWHPMHPTTRGHAYRRTSSPGDSLCAYVSESIVGI